MKATEIIKNLRLIMDAYGKDVDVDVCDVSDPVGIDYIILDKWIVLKNGSVSIPVEPKYSRYNNEI